MSAGRTYLDWNATAPLRPQARAAMEAALGVTGNPSSVHQEGRAARRLIADAREQVAQLVGADPAGVVFTSGGTEANMLALSPLVEVAGVKELRQRLLVSAIEHPSVLAGGRFRPADIERIPVNAAGTVDLAALSDRLGVLRRESVSRVLVSVMLANNETGAVQPVDEVAHLVHEAGGLLHVDAIQAAGRLPCDINALGADILTLSGHKIGGPQGVGAMVFRTDRLHIADPLLKGGGQERGVRAGTENTAAIAGFGAAAALAVQAVNTEADQVRDLRDRLETRLLEISADTVIFAKDAARLPNTTLFAVPGMKAETAVIALDLDGMAVSSGAACSSGKVQPSHVLAAMGVGDALARGAIRVSLGHATTENDIESFLGAWNKLSESLRKGRRDIAA